MMDWAAFQIEVYFAGIGGELPKLPFRYDDLMAAAREVLDDRAFGYVAGGAGRDRTMAHNRDAFSNHRILPRMMVDISLRDLSTSVLGIDLPTPIILAPVGVQSIIHDQGELATARGAAAVGFPMTASTAASNTLEDIKTELGDTPGLFQLYWPANRELAASLVQRAEAAGYDAIVVTLDTKLLAWRPWDLETAYLPFLHGEGLANYRADPVFQSLLAKPWDDDPGSAIITWAGLFADAAITWDDIAWLKEQTSLPVVLKGILHPDDARTAIEHGADGIIVSNHGGRQVDNSIAAIDALPAVVAAAGDAPVLFDSGIRSGADVLVALALGARACFVGRPVCWGLALDGADGVTHVLRSLAAELDLSMALSGVTRIDQINRSLLA